MLIRLLKYVGRNVDDLNLSFKEFLNKRFNFSLSFKI